MEIFAWFFYGGLSLITITGSVALSMYIAVETYKHVSN